MRSSRFYVRIAPVVVITLTVVLSACGAKGSTSGSSTDAAADGFPSKPFTIVVESTPGSPVDVLARQIGKYSEKYLGQSVVVDNKPGGGSATQLQAIKTSEGKGYTLGTGTRSLMTSLNTTLKGKYSVDDFVFVAQLQRDPYVFAVNASSDVKNLEDMVQRAKAEPKYSLGGFGAQSAFSLLADQFGKQAGFKPNYVPFDGGAAAVTAVLGNQIDAVVTNVSNVAPQVKAKKLRVLAVTSDQPDPAIGTEVPTFTSLGYKNAVLSHWRGIFVKAGTPNAVVAKLDEGFKKMLADPGFLQYLTEVGLTPGYLDHVAFQQQVKKDVADIDEQLKTQ